MVKSPRTLRLELDVNGSPVTLDVVPSLLLIELLRDELHLTGAKRGCDVQVCGACTVLVQGQPVSSCCYLAVDAAGKSVVTCEGLQSDGRLSRIQEAFIKEGAFQCGYCTPGMLVMATAFLREFEAPDAHDVRSYMDGNLCRCTGYAKIVKAILAVAGDSRACP